VRVVAGAFSRFVLIEPVMPIAQMRVDQRTGAFAPTPPKVSCAR